MGYIIGFFTVLRVVIFGYGMDAVLGKTGC